MPDLIENHLVGAEFLREDGGTHGWTDMAKVIDALPVSVTDNRDRS